MRVGIAGYMGAGKSECARLLCTRDCVVIDADSEAKGLMSHSAAIQGQLATAFGGDVVAGTGLDFGALGRRAFESRGSLERLNGIVHPPLLEHLAGLMGARVEGSCILDAALIPYWGIEHWFDRVVWVSCPDGVRKRRIEQKASLDRGAIEQRMVLQEELMPAPRGEPWIRIDNKGSREELRAALIAAGLIDKES